MRSDPTNALVPRGRVGRQTLPASLVIANGRNHTSETIVRAWFAGKSDNTIRAYQRDLEAFAQYFSLALGVRPALTVYETLDKLFQQSAPSAHEIVLAFREWLVSAGLSSCTINRHLATLRSVAKLARMLGLSTWVLEVPGLRPEKRRNTAGPSMDVVNRMIAASSGDDERETRNAAIITVFTCLGLRVSELCGLTMQDTDLDGGTTWILGKGRRERELVPLPSAAVSAIRRYVVHRGKAPGPLFQTLGRRGKARDGALETRSVLRIVRELGRRVQHHVWCHGLRHTSITQAVELGQQAGYGLEKIKAHSRHKNITTLMTYVDEHDRTGSQRAIADLVADKVAVPRFSD